MKLATWNINSLTVRLPQVLDWLATNPVDVLCLQELKLSDDKFPRDALQQAGYHSAVFGQKTYNGVAILARTAPTDVAVDIPGFADEQRRVIAATVGDLRIVDLYVVNGQEVGSDKYRYKLDWLAAVTDWLRDEIAKHPKLVVLGDFNIAPDDRDVHDPESWHEQVLCSTPEREALERILGLGLHDSFRLKDDSPGQFSWWDYRQAAFRRNLGLRIDLVLVSDALRSNVQSVGIDRVPRTWERPSDHAPAWIELG
jgi:exodeoxyribonuclease-3